jgi:hypothetical protein
MPAPADTGVVMSHAVPVRCVFTLVGGFLGRIDSASRCAFWAEDPADHAFDPARLISIDLARTPKAALAGRIAWDEVQVDDCYTGPTGQVSGTTLGPRWPELQVCGLVLLERRFIASLPAELHPASPPAGADGRAYEFVHALYAPDGDDPRAGQRYAGHHAVILEERGTLARVAVHPPGTSTRVHASTFTLWIDLASPEHCDAGPACLTEIGVGAAPKAGALFLHAGSLAPDRL